jgi:hypothetical protein
MKRFLRHASDLPGLLPSAGLTAIWLLVASSLIARADPILSSWYTRNSSSLARVVQTTSTSTGARNINAVTTWPTVSPNNNAGGLAQSVPVYADVQRIHYTATDVYINASGLASYTMGPWLTATNGLFGFWPLARDYSTRITRTPVPAPTKVRHGGGMIGMMVNGVAIYDLGDAFSFNQTNTTAPAATTVTGADAMGAAGDGYWSRDALAVEVVTFDPGFAHQPGNNGQYHYHAQPKALRYQLGDNMTATYSATNNTYTYTETDPSGSVAPLHHSPILGWCFDGYPIYGPYGYSSAMNPNSTVTRMRTGFVLRNSANAATYGTANIVAAGRITLPKWVAAAHGYTFVPNANNDHTLTPLNQYGPTTATLALGRYTGDYDYLGDRGRTQAADFDLDQYNGRNCVTPEFPGGTYAYFVTIDASGNTVFPHMLCKQYYGTQNATSGAPIPGTATLLFNGGPNTAESFNGGPAIAPGSGNVTLTWSSVEGGTYQVEASSDLKAWTPIATSVPAAASSTQTSLTENASAMPANTTQRFYKVKRTSTAAYDPAYTGQ